MAVKEFATRVLLAAGTYPITAQEMPLNPFGLTRKQFIRMGAILPVAVVSGVFGGTLGIVIGPMLGSPLFKQLDWVPMPAGVAFTLGCVLLFVAIVALMGPPLTYLSLSTRKLQRFIQAKYQISITRREARTLLFGDSDLDTFDGRGRIDVTFFDETVTVRLVKQAGQEAVLNRITQNAEPEVRYVYGETESPLF